MSKLTPAAPGSSFSASRGGQRDLLGVEQRAVEKQRGFDGRLGVRMVLEPGERLHAARLLGIHVGAEATMATFCCVSSPTLR